MGVTKYKPEERAIKYQQKKQEWADKNREKVREISRNAYHTKYKFDPKYIIPRKKYKKVAIEKRNNEIRPAIDFMC